jgi:lysozyme
MTRRFSIAVLLGAAAMFITFGLCFFGVWIPNEPSRASYPLSGIDVSHHQKEIRWKLVKACDIHFTYIKATEGADFKDPKFLENWSESSAVDLVHGAYHFFTLGTSGKLQASNFIATVPIEPNALPPAIDLEISGYNKTQTQSPQDFQRELSIFWNTVVTHYGKTPVVYTTKDFRKRYLAQMPLERLWIREVIFKPQEDWMFWQFSARGRVKGISTFVDLNVFNGAAPDFQGLLGRN